MRHPVRFAAGLWRTISRRVSSSSAQSGEPLGLQSVLPAFGKKTIDSKLTFAWRPEPGSALGISAIRCTAAALREAGRRLSADEGPAFLELVDLVLRKTDGRVPAEDPAMTVLLGRPLALVHASLGLEVEGLPAGYWQTDNQQNLIFGTEDCEKLRVAVQLGGMNLPADGLVGYLPENDPPCLVASDGAGAHQRQ